MSRFKLLCVAFSVALLMLLTTTALAVGGAPLVATLSGANEIPGPGDPDATGSARITVNPGQGMICWDITISGITLPASAAHIHVGGADVAGPVVVPLSAPDANGDASGCATVDRALALAILRSPESYYVNVHTVPLYQAGAARGQLSHPGGGD